MTTSTYKMKSLIGQKIKSSMLVETYTKTVTDVVDVDAKSINIHFDDEQVINLEPDQYIRLVDDGVSYIPNLDGSYFDVEMLTVQ